MYFKTFYFRNTGCASLETLTTKSFLSVGGNKLWIKDIQSAPFKMRRLTSISQMLWSCPWKITHQNIKVSF